MDAEELIRSLARFSADKRMKLMLNAIGTLPDEDWLKALGQSWSMSDHVESYLDDLLHSSPLATAARPVRAMMTDDEFDAWTALPETVDMYRGCYKGLNDNGICFSLNQLTAEFFLKHSRYAGSDVPPVLLHCRAKKTDIIAVKLDRSEDEIIVDDYEFVKDLLGNYEHV